MSPESITEFITRQRAERASVGLTETITDADTLRVVAAILAAPTHRAIEVAVAA
jgi:hypothetical protein